MHLFLNGLAASAGGGLTYLRNVVPELSKRTGIQATIAVGQELRFEFTGLPNISCAAPHAPAGALLRFWREQTDLGGLITDSGADLLISTGNFALKSSPVPQILLSGNSLYTSRDFHADLRSRGEYGLLLDSLGKELFAKRSLHWAECTVAPSLAFAKELTEWTGVEVRTIPHGFDRERFFRDQSLLPAEIQRKLDAAQDSVRLLFVSHYNYYRNFETLFRAIPILQKRVGSQRIKLFLTCELALGKNPGAYNPDFAASLVRKLNISDSVVELGAVPYRMLHRLYGACHIYVTPAYTETFAHPLVEAMAAKLPVVASDLAVHREVCGEAAVYFGRFSPDELAAQVAGVLASPEMGRTMAAKGLARSQDFSWQTHVDEILALAGSL